MKKLTDDNFHDIEKILSDAWLNVRIDDAQIEETFQKIPPDFSDCPELFITWVLSQPDFFSFTCKELFGLHILPFQGIVLEELWNRKFPMMVCTRGFSKTLLLGVYALLRAIFGRNEKIVICGSSFRQSKLVFNYIENLIENSPILRDIVYFGKNNPIQHHNDNYKISIGSSYIIGVPLGTGDKIRGLRASVILTDEFSSIPIDIFETVIAGFAAVSSNPADKVRRLARERMAEKLGIVLEDSTSLQGIGGNQIVISGTAYYDFNHFAQYHKRWTEIIKSRGDSERLKKALGSDTDINLNYKDFSIIRVPALLLPEGYMDADQLSRSKATMTSSNFEMEFSCFGPDTNIILDSGVKKIQEVNIGDMVLTHKGRFRPVVAVSKRKINSDIIRLKSYGYDKDILVTPEHPFYNGKDFIPVNDIEKCYLSNLVELSNKKYIDLSDICDKYISVNDYIYPSSSKNKFTNEQINFIIKECVKFGDQSRVARILNTCPSRINSILKQKRPKNANNKIINLDYHFGICLGYYASEGCCGKNNVQFSLDGHVDDSLENMVNQLDISILKSIGVKPKHYKYNNVVNICINSRITKDLFKYICPGDCYNKTVKSDILFSNRDLLKGFIIGIFNGDGHKRNEYSCIQLCNLNLLNQVKLALSYFGISSSISKQVEAGESQIQGRKVYISDSYKLSMFGKNHKKFLKEFFGISRSKRDVNKYINNDNYNSIFDIEKISIEKYDGYVYNLEVKEDNSYSLINATVHNCVFSKDSQGFFKRKMIEACVVKPGEDWVLPDNKVIPSNEIFFEPMLRGDPNKEYVFAIDPAARLDNFSIVILERNIGYRKIVYCWTTNEKRHKKQAESGFVKEKNYYAFCCRKIRDLMRNFNCVGIGIDYGGGGGAIIAGLQDEDKIEQLELPIYHRIDYTKPRDTDGKSGLHLIYEINFNTEWSQQANHSLRKDMEDKILVFPYIDGISYIDADESLEVDELKMEKDKPISIDPYSEVVFEIEELKNELSMIVVTETATGKEHWDTPETKTNTGKKTRLRKDRYSALLMANDTCRKIFEDESVPRLSATDGGGFASAFKNTEKSSLFKSGPNWAINALSSAYD